MARPTELPSAPPIDLPRSDTTLPATLLPTVRATLRAITWPVDSRPRGTLAPKIVPTMVERVMVRPPSARIGPVTPEERKAIISASPVKGKYDTAIDSESAYEMLQKRVAATAAPADASAGGGGGILGQIGAIVGTIFGANVPRGRLSTGQVIARSVARTVGNKVAGSVVSDLGKSMGGALGSSVGRAIVRGTLGGLLRR
jgi:DNA helicase HerA-like ATPase